MAHPDIQWTSSDETTVVEPEVVDLEESDPDMDGPTAVPVNAPAKAGKQEDKLPALNLTPSSKAVQVRDPLQLYLKEIARFPMLEPEEEYALAKRVQEENDQDAAFKLVFLPFAPGGQDRHGLPAPLDAERTGPDPGGQRRAAQGRDQVRPGKGIKFSYYAAF